MTRAFPRWPWPPGDITPAWRAAAVLASLALGAVAPPAAAHAILVESIPAPGGSLKAGLVGFSLRFNSRLDHELSIMTLTGPDGRQQRLPIDPEAPADQLKSSLSLLSGHYSLRWQVLAIDGHVTRGDVPFDLIGP